MDRVAIGMQGEEICNSLEVCKKFNIYDLKGYVLVNKNVAFNHESSVVDFLKGEKVHTVFGKGVSKQTEMELNQNDIECVICEDENPDAVISNFVHD